MKNTSKTRRTIFLICLLCSSFMQMIAQTEESVTVAYDFSKKTEVYGMKFANDLSYIPDKKDIKIQDITLSLLNSIYYYNGANNGYIRLIGSPLLGYKAGSLKFSAPAGCTITKITFTAAPYNGEISKLINENNGKELSCEKKGTCSAPISTQSVTFNQKNNESSYITKIAVTYTRNKPDVAFEEKSSATPQTISDNIGKTSCTINRAFNNNYMNTLCMPFDLTCEKIREIFGEGTTIYRYADSSNGNIYLNSSSTADVPAGTPIIIKPEIYVDSPVFTGISISDKEPKEVNHSDIALCGTYAPYEMNTDGSEVFLNTSQKFTKPKAGQNTMRGFRCFFRKTDNGVKELSAIFDNNETDGISSKQSDNPKVNSKIYTIYGNETSMPWQYLAPGIYIIEGKKILIEK